MYRIIIVAMLAFSGCSNMKFNATICDEIRTEPNSVVPSECQVYSEEKAQKAFDKVEDEKQSEKDRVEFNR